MQAFWGGAELLQRFVVVLGGAVHGFSSEVARVFDLKTILLTNSYFFTKDEKWNHEN